MAAGKEATVTLMAGGDIGPIVEPTEQFAELIAPVLRQADLRFGEVLLQLSRQTGSSGLIVSDNAVLDGHIHCN